MKPFIEVKDVFRDYTMGSQTVHALKNISMAVNDGDFMALAGSSGSGKTTLLNMIGCIDTPTQGEVLFDGQSIQGMSSKALAELRSKKIGFIFQTFNLLPVLTALENVEYPLLLLKVPKRERLEMSRAALEQLGLGKFIHHRPAELSGGQRQRVAIARALVKNPRVVLADEPTANLDSVTANEILDVMKELNEKLKVTFIFSTHDSNVLERAGQIIRLRSGEQVVENSAKVIHLLNRRMNYAV